MVKEPDQLRISEIPSSAVPHGEKKWCHIHQRSYKVYYTRRKNDETNRVKTVLRVWHCPECGEKSRYPETNAKSFKIVPRHGTHTTKVPNDEN